MEILAYVLGVFTILLVMGVVVIVRINSLVKELKERVRDLEGNLNTTVNIISDTKDVLHRCIDDESAELQKTIDMIHQRMDREVREILSMVDSRLDKLENKISSKIPPTNQEVLGELKKLKDEFLILRQNL